jgi:hypothetical protein
MATPEENGAIVARGSAEGRKKAVATGAPAVALDDLLGAAEVTGGEAGATAPGEKGKRLQEAALTGGVAGGMAGGLLGAAAVAAGLIPGLGPVLAGGLLAVLRRLGVAEAHFYQRELAAGRTLVAVEVRDRQAETRTILRQRGGYDATTPGPV